MKILSIAYNYPEYSTLEPWEQPLAEVARQTPLVVHKGDALLRPKYPFFIPEWCEQFGYEAHIVLQISRVGKCIAERFAHRYYQQVSVGIDFTARPLLRQAVEQGRPWSESKCFEGSAVVGEWIDKEELGYPSTPLEMHLEEGGVLRQHCQSGEMLHSIDRIIAHISRRHTLKMGDIIFTGTPSGGGLCQIGQTLDGYLGGRHLLHIDIK